MIQIEIDTMQIKLKPESHAMHNKTWKFSVGFICRRDFFYFFDGSVQPKRDKFEIINNCYLAFGILYSSCFILLCSKLKNIKWMEKNSLARIMSM